MHRMLQNLPQGSSKLSYQFVELSSLDYFQPGYFLWIIIFYCCAEWRYIVAFTKVLTIHQMYHTWIHRLHRSPNFQANHWGHERKECTEWQATALITGLDILSVSLPCHFPPCPPSQLLVHLPALPHLCSAEYNLSSCSGTQKRCERKLLPFCLVAVIR
jgi:hypothetical protein